MLRRQLVRLSRGVCATLRVLCHGLGSCGGENGDAPEDEKRIVLFSL
jgi:hypothetical protein